ncbi:hypothetical protein PG989_009417 [Apiospora arundinis]
MAHLSMTGEDEARLLKHGSNGDVVEMIMLAKELAEKRNITTGEVMVQIEDASGQHLGHHCAKGGAPTHRAALARCLMEFVLSQKVLRKLFLEARDRSGNTTLMIAARQGHARMVALLASQGAFINTKNDAKQTIIHQAVHAHSIETLETAISLGAETDVKDVHDRTPLSHAVHYNDLEACQRLIDKRAGLSATDGQGNTVLHLAAKAGHLEIVSAILDSGASTDTECNKGTTALHLAAAWGHKAVVALLIDEGADVNAKDSACSTPLHVAVTSRKDGTLDCIEVLLANEHVIPELRDTWWRTAEELAQGREDVLAVFKRMSKSN